MQDGKDDGNGGKDDTPMDVTLETLREVNDPCVLLEKYDAVTAVSYTHLDGYKRQEYYLIELLVKNPRRVYSRENLMDLVWGYTYAGDYRTVDVLSLIHI